MRYLLLVDPDEASLRETRGIVERAIGANGSTIQIIATKDVTPGFQDLARVKAGDRVLVIMEFVLREQTQTELRQTVDQMRRMLSLLLPKEFTPTVVAYSTYTDRNALERFNITLFHKPEQEMLLLDLVDAFVASQC